MKLKVISILFGCISSCAIAANDAGKQHEQVKNAVDDVIERKQRDDQSANTRYVLLKGVENEVCQTILEYRNTYPDSFGSCWLKEHADFPKLRVPKYVEVEKSDRLKSLVVESALIGLSDKTAENLLPGNAKWTEKEEVRFWKTQIDGDNDGEQDDIVSSAETPCKYSTSSSFEIVDGKLSTVWGKRVSGTPFLYNDKTYFINLTESHNMHVYETGRIGYTPYNPRISIFGELTVIHLCTFSPEKI